MDQGKLFCGTLRSNGRAKKNHGNPFFVILQYSIHAFSYQVFPCSPTSISPAYPEEVLETAELSMLNHVIISTVYIYVYIYICT